MEEPRTIDVFDLYPHLSKDSLELLKKEFFQLFDAAKYTYSV